MLIDEAQIVLSGGHGGAGRVSFGKMAKSGPDGGNGGRGGDFYIEASSDLTLLNQFSVETEFAAEDGAEGGQNRKTGRDGADRTIYLPTGTTLVELETIRENDLVTSGETYELTKVGERFLVAKGGKGGKGNWEFRAPHRTTPKFAQSGIPGERRKFSVNLRYIATYGLVGLPNAGKSSLLNELTQARAKVGAYAFTTLSPNLGSLYGKIIADIPGLIVGAHAGRGLGIKFLKHIEKVSVLIHCISAETANFMKDYQTIRQELGKYNETLLAKPEIILITKSDLVDEKQIVKLKKQALKHSKEVYCVSVFDYDSIKNLTSALTK